MGSTWFLPGIYKDFQKILLYKGFFKVFHKVAIFGNPHGFGTESIREFYKGSIRGFYKVSIGDL